MCTYRHGCWNECKHADGDWRNNLQLPLFGCCLVTARFPRDATSARACSSFCNATHCIDSVDENGVGVCRESTKRGRFFAFTNFTLRFTSPTAQSSRVDVEKGAIWEAICSTLARCRCGFYGLLTSWKDRCSRWLNVITDGCANTGVWVLPVVALRGPTMSHEREHKGLDLAHNVDVWIPNIKRQNTFNFLDVILGEHYL